MSVSAWQRCFLSHGQNGKGCKKRCTIAPFAGSGSWLKPAGDGGLDDESMVELTELMRKASPEKRKALIELLKSDKEN